MDLLRSEDFLPVRWYARAVVGQSTCKQRTGPASLSGRTRQDAIGAIPTTQHYGRRLPPHATRTSGWGVHCSLLTTRTVLAVTALPLLAIAPPYSSSLLE